MFYFLHQTFSLSHAILPKKKNRYLKLLNGVYNSKIKCHQRVENLLDSRY